MPEEFRPRENDHLVEPMFEALREPPDQEGPRPRPRRWWWWGLGGLVLVAILLLWAVLAG